MRGELSRLGENSLRLRGESSRLRGESSRFRGESSRFWGESSRLTGEIEGRIITINRRIITIEGENHPPLKACSLRRPRHYMYNPPSSHPLWDLTGNVASTTPTLLRSPFLVAATTDHGHAQRLCMPLGLDSIYLGSPPPVVIHGVSLTLFMAHCGSLWYFRELD